MIGIVPLAGPDFDLADGRVKAEVEVAGEPLLRRTLDGRSWRRSGALCDDDMVFVLRDSVPSRRFAAGPLRGWYPGASTVFLSAPAAGAALSALAGLAVLADRPGPVVVDLADIAYRDAFDPVAAFAADSRLGGALATFPAADPVYSYAALDAEGFVIETAEKRVISAHASAGTYLFRTPAIYAAAVARTLAEPHRLHRGLLYVCPVLNGVVGAGLKVAAVPVTDVEDVKQAGREGSR